METLGFPPHPRGWFSIIVYQSLCWIESSTNAPKTRDGKNSEQLFDVEWENRKAEKG
jgi:hypothetical protein